MTSPARDPIRDASWQAYDTFRSAPEPIRRAARTAIEDGNQETFISLVTEFLQTPVSGHMQPRLAPEVLNRVDWDWLGGGDLPRPPPHHRGPPPPPPPPPPAPPPGKF